MEKKMSIGNVNILDLQNATDASVATIDQIGNVNMLVYSSETARLLPRLKIGNANCSVLVPPGVAVHRSMGETVLHANDLDSLSAKLVLMVAMGQLVISADVTSEQIEKGLAGLIVMGELIYPSSLASVVQSKVLQQMGAATSYPPFSRVKLNSLTLDERYLDGLPDNTDLAIVGDLSAPTMLPNTRLEQKLQKLFVSGKITCHEENAQVLQSKRTGDSDAIKIIPAGFEWVNKPLTLDRDQLALLPSKKLYCTQRLHITDEVDAAALDGALERIIGEELMLCPTPIKSIFLQKCDVFHSQVAFYESKLILVEDSQTLSVTRLSSLKSKATLVVTGILNLDSDVSPALITERLAKVHNLGIINGSLAQLDAIEELLGLREGQLHATEESASSDQTNESDVNWISSMSILTL